MTSTAGSYAAVDAAPATRKAVDGVSHSIMMLIMRRIPLPWRSARGACGLPAGGEGGGSGGGCCLSYSSVSYPSQSHEILKPHVGHLPPSHVGQSSYVCWHTVMPSGHLHVSRRQRLQFVPPHTAHRAMLRLPQVHALSPHKVGK